MIMKKSIEEQLAMFEHPNAEQLVADYINDGLKLYYAIMVELTKNVPEEVRIPIEHVYALRFGFVSPPEIPITLSEKDKREIPCGDYLCEPAQRMILDKFSQEVAKDLLLKYGRAWPIYEMVQLRMVQYFPEDEGLEVLGEIRNPCDNAILQAIELYSKEAMREFLLDNAACLSDVVLKKVMEVFTSEQAKDIIIKYMEVHPLSDEIQKEITEKLKRDDARIILMKAMLFFGTKLSKETFEYLKK